jgi:hypothetical protein
MSAIAGNSGYVSFVCRFTLRTAIFLIISDDTATSVMLAFIVFVCHKSNSSLVRKIIFVAAATALIIALPVTAGNEKLKIRVERQKS